MYQTAEVIEKKENDVVLVICPHNACANCHSSMFCNIKDRSFTVLNSKRIDLKKGDNVEIFLSPRKTVSSSFLLLGFPLVLFPIGYIIAPFINEIAKAGVGLTFSALAFLITYFVNKAKKRQLMPIITKVIKLDTEQ